MDMKWSQMIRILLILGAYILPARLAGASNGVLNLEKRDYRVIAERNPFGLRPPPAPRTNVVAAHPKDAIFLTRITSIG